MKSLTNLGQGLSFRVPQIYTTAGARTLTTSRDSNPDEQEIARARNWLKKYTGETIPKTIGDLSFSRSSGPGGQNVNKVNSKATLRVPLAQLTQIVPPLLHDHLKASTYYARNTDSLIINASESRKQQDNAQSCYRKLSALIHEVGAAALPGETSDAQRSKVKRLQEVENERRIKFKKMQSNKKGSRRGGWD